MITLDVSLVPVAGVLLEAQVDVPESASGLVLFTQAAGSGRAAPRNRLVANALRDAGLGTALVDLLTLEEAGDPAVRERLRDDLDLLGRRLVGVIDWIDADPALSGMALGLFGASSAAGPTLRAAAERPELVRAVVCRGGAVVDGAHLPRVTAPTLMLAGARDPEVQRVAAHAASVLGGPCRVEIVPGAGRLFEEPGGLERVSALAREWFVRHLGRPGA